MEQYENRINLTPEIATKLKANVSLRIGTLKNYIVPNPIGVERDGLKKWSKHEKMHIGDFAKFKQSGDSNSYYAINLMSVPHITLDTLKIGLFLFHHALCKDKWQFVFSLLEEDVRNSLFGEERYLYIGKPSLKNSLSFAMPIKSLPTLLRDNNVHLASSDLTSSLKTLYDYGFITLTPISTEHCIKTDIPEINTKCVYIDINLGAVTAKINGRWKLQKTF